MHSNKAVSKLCTHHYIHSTRYQLDVVACRFIYTYNIQLGQYAYNQLYKMIIKFHIEVSYTQLRICILYNFMDSQLAGSLLQVMVSALPFMHAITKILFLLQKLWLAHPRELFYPILCNIAMKISVYECLSYINTFKIMNF